MLDDKLQVLLLLSSLLDSEKTLVILFNNSAPNSIIILKMIKYGMFNKKIRRKEQDVST